MPDDVPDPDPAEAEHGPYCAACRELGLIAKRDAAMVERDEARAELSQAREALDLVGRDVAAELERARLVLQAATALVEHWRNPAWAHGIEFERDCAPGSVKARTVELTDALAERVEEVKR